MRTLVFACLKGGAGKTTMSGHIGVSLSSADVGQVVLLDLDPQESLSAWWNDREAEEPAFATVERVADLPAKVQQLAEAGFGWCVIDTPPSDGAVSAAAIEVADLVVIPVKASPHDIRAAVSTVNFCQAANKKFVFLVNEVTGKAMAMDAVVALASMGAVVPQVITKLNGFASSMADGRTILELTPKAKSTDDLCKVRDFLVSQFPEGKKPKKEKQRV
jgi:chromosome partitioning protein